MSMTELLREGVGQADAAGFLLRQMAMQPVAGLAGGSRTLIDLLRGQGVDRSMAAGARTVEDVQGLGGAPFTRRGAERVRGLGGLVQGATDRVGDALGNPIDKLAEVPTFGPALAAGALGLVETADPTKGAGRAAKAAKRAVSKAKGTTTPLKAIERGAVDAPSNTGVAARFQGGENAGMYRGTEAFGGISPQKLGNMRAEYLRAMEAGAEGRDWYDRTSATNLKLTGGDVARADKLADIEAITSARTPVRANLMYSAKGVNQALVGDPVRTGGFPVNMGKQIEQTWNAESRGEGLGLKRSPYRAGLAVAWNGPESVKRATHDIHDVRAWGIEDPVTGGPWSKGVAPAGHRFLDAQADWARDTANARRIGGFDDWNLHKSQAAAWIAQKAQRKGMSVADAAKDYTDFVPDVSAQITREWTPGATANHLPEMLRAPDSVRRDYASRMEEAVKGPQGIDKLASDMGMLSDTTLPNLGTYEGQINPGYASQVLVGKDGGSQNMDPASRRAAEAVAAAHGLIGVQDQSALNFIGGAGSAPISRAGAFQVATGAPMTDTGLANVSRIASQFGGDVAQVDPRGARVLSFHDEGDPRRAAMIEALRAEYPHADVSAQARDSSLFPLKEGSYWEKPDTWSSKPYIEKIEAGGPQMVAGFDRSMRDAAPQMLKVTEAVATQHGFTQAPWYGQMMKALSTEGLAGLKKLVAQGIVPVAAFAVIAESLQNEEGPQ